MVPEQVCIAKAKTMCSKSDSTVTLSACSEILAGPLTMLGLAGAPDLRVAVKVYRTSLEHFAVVYPDKVICKPIGYVNLKNCTVELSKTNVSCGTFQVVRNSCDGGVLTFRCDSNKDVKMWVDAMRPTCRVVNSGRISSKSKMDDWHLGNHVSLPILEEGDEE